MTLARDGWREMAVITVVLGGATALLAVKFWPAAIVTALLWLAGLAFFRVPNRAVPDGRGLLVAPADGRITDITPLPHEPNIGGPALRIGIFLSVFDVHVNRSPCDARVVQTLYKPGEFLDARHPQCGERNEANTIVLAPDEPIPGPIVVRQIAGLIARRIVCRLATGQAVRRGELCGLIKFGSRTELIVPAERGLEPAVAIGQHVAGGATVLMRLSAPSDRDTGGRGHEEPRGLRLAGRSRAEVA